MKNRLNKLPMLFIAVMMFALSLPLAVSAASSVPAGTSGDTSAVSSTTSGEDTETPTQNIQPYTIRTGNSVSFNVSAAENTSVSNGIKYTLTDVEVSNPVDQAYKTVNILAPAELKIQYGTLPSGWNITTDGGSSVFVISNKTTGTAAAIINFLQNNVYFVLNTGNAFPPDESTITVTVEEEMVSAWVDKTGKIHYYKPVYNSNIHWLDAYNAAKNTTYNGLKGYLATITSEAEQKYVYESVVTECMWLGGVRMRYKDGTRILDPDSIPVPAGAINSGNVKTQMNTSYKTEAETGMDWYWADGPEAGTVFMTQPTKTWNPAPEYTGWTAWAGGEPNNAGTEYVLQWGWSSGQLWNDFNILPASAVKGYLVEFGGYDDDPTFQATNAHTADVPAPVEVKYLDQDNGTLGTTVYRIGNIGAQYTTSALATVPTGYTYKGVVGNATGKYTNKKITVIYSYTINTHSVTFNPQGGEPTPQSQNVAYNGKVTDPGTVSKTGYDFGGWYTAANGGGTQWQFGQNGTNMPDSDVTLHAKWTARRGYVKFDGNGSTTTPAMANQTVYYDQQVNLTQNTYKLAGNTFLGWNTEKDGSGTTYGDKALYKNEQPGTDTVVTLYAQWGTKVYKLNFNSNTGTGEMTSVNVNYGTATNLPANTFEKAGYQFAGWNTQANGNGTSYVDEASYTHTTEDAATLYAQWTPREYKVQFNGNYATLGSMEDITVKFEVNQNLPKNKFEKSGYSFAGWNTQVDGNGTSYADEASYKHTTVGDVTLYAKWTANSYKVQFNANGGTGSMSDMAIKFDASSNLTKNSYKRDGYQFEGWNTQADGNGTSYADEASYQHTTVGNLTLYAKWAPIGYVVQFNKNGGDSEGTMQDLPVTFDVSQTLPQNVYSKTGYQFAGWNTQANGSGTPYADKASYKHQVEGSVTLYAQWTANSYTLQFNANGGTGSMSDISVTFDASQALPKNEFEKSGYSFAGWTTVADGSGDSYANKASYKHKTASNVILYAKWTANSYAVEFNGNGATDGSMSNMAITFNATSNLSQNQYKRAGYVFTGWNTQSDGNGTSYTDEASYTHITAGNFTLYAQWEQENYTLIYMPNNATSGIVPTDGNFYHYGDSIQTATNTGSLKKIGATFVGWNTSADGTGTHYAEEGSIVITGNTVLYAEFTAEEKVVLTYDFNGGTSTNSSTVEVVKDSFISLCASSTVTPPAGQMLLSWTDVETGTTYSPGCRFLISKNTTLRAEYKNKITLTYHLNGYAVNASGGALQDIAYDKAENSVCSALNGSYYYNSDRTRTATSWNTKPDGSGTTYYFGQSLTLTSSLDLYPVFAGKTYVVNYAWPYDYNYDGTTPIKTSVEEGKSFTLVAPGGTVDGCQFAGYVYTVNGKSTQIAYANGAFSPSTIQMPATNITLEAIFNTSAMKFGFVTESDGNTYYYDRSGNKVTGWTNIDGKTYYMNPWNGIVIKGWANVDGYTRYFDPTSGTLTKGWANIDGYTRYFDTSSGTLTRGWANIDGYTRYFDTSSGTLTRGWASIDGYTRYFDVTSGTLTRGWANIDGYTRYFDMTSGTLTRGWANIDGYTRYFDMTSGTLTKGWASIDGYTRYFDMTSGTMTIGWANIDGRSYYFNQWGALEG